MARQSEGRSLCWSRRDGGGGGGRGGIAEEERWGLLVAPAPSMWYQGALALTPPMGSPEATGSLTIAASIGQTGGGELFGLQTPPRKQEPNLRNERLIGLNPSSHIRNSSRAGVQTQLVSDLDNQPYY